MQQRREPYPSREGDLNVVEKVPLTQQKSSEGPSDKQHCLVTVFGDTCKSFIECLGRNGNQILEHLQVSVYHYRQQFIICSRFEININFWLERRYFYFYLINYERTLNEKSVSVLGYLSRFIDLNSKRITSVRIG